MSKYKIMLEKAIKENNLEKMLFGKDEYKEINDDFDFNVYGNLTEIHEYYKNHPESNINNKIIEILEKKMNDDPFDILITYYYTYFEIYIETKNLSSFKFPEEYYEKLKECILKNSEKLQNYKSNEFGDNGMQYIYNAEQYKEQENRRKIL